MFTIEGKIKALLPIEEFTNFQKQTLILEFEQGEFTNIIKIDFLGDKVSLLNGFNVGQSLKVYFNIKAKEWNERYFNNVTAWRIEEKADTNGHQTSGFGDVKVVDKASKDDLNSSPFDDNLPF